MWLGSHGVGRLTRSQLQSLLDDARADSLATAHARWPTTVVRLTCHRGFLGPLVRYNRPDPISGWLPGCDIEPVPGVGERNGECQCRELTLAKVKGSLVPHLIRHSIGLVSD